MRLIDADAKILTQVFDEEHEEWTREEMTVEEYLSYSDTAIPFVDAVPVVRCMECRWGKEVCGNIECSTDRNAPPEYHGYDWFCADGERKDGADNG